MTPAASSSAASIVSAVVAPAILILACSSLITTTANRLSLLLRRVRELAHEMESSRSGASPARREFTATLLSQGAVRVKFLQRTLAVLYLALGCLVFASVCIGASAWVGVRADLIASGALASVAFLFYASTLLIRESRLALKAVNAEMAYVRALVENAQEASHAG